MAKDGEKFVSLEDKEYMLDDKSLGICDEEGVQCLGGIMGGAAKGCCDETQNVFLECALFTPECIARTGRKFGIDSDIYLISFFPNKVSGICTDFKSGCTVV